MPAPTVADVTTYLGPDISWDTGAITDAYNAERASQSRACRVPVPRDVQVTTTASSADITASLGAFTSSDVGREVTGTGIPDGALVLSVSSDGATATLTANATASGTVTASLVDPWPADLAQALCRRVAVNLSLRSLPLGVQVTLSDTNVSTTRVGGGDAEVRRLEGPFRKWTVG